MAATTSAHQRPVSLRTKLLIMCGVPTVIFLLLELICAFLIGKDSAANAAVPHELEMPTWMLEEDNSRARASRILVDARAREWLAMFQSGSSFRVHLIPSRDFLVFNTFSLLEGDKERKYRVVSNKLGFRGKDPLPRAGGEKFTVAIFGDSSSFGWGVEEDETYGSLLAAMLEKKFASKGINQPVELLNFAIPGDSSEYGKLIFEEFSKEYPADLVIFGFGANDAKKVITPHMSQVEKFKREPSKIQHLVTGISSFARRSALYRTLESLVKRASSPTPAADASLANVVAVPPKRYRENLKTMGLEAASTGARQVVLLTLCSPQSYRKIARQVANKNDFSYLDGQSLLVSSIHALKQERLLPAEVAELKRNYSSDLAKNDLFYVTSDGCHPNALGHKLVANQLFEILENRLEYTE